MGILTQKRPPKRFNNFLIILGVASLIRINSYCGGSVLQCKKSSPDITTSQLQFPIIKSWAHNLREKSVERTQKFLPSPHSELLLGMTVGIDLFAKLPQFQEMLLRTGTIHVVVVSGYNISLVYSLVEGFVGSFRDRKRLVLGFLITSFYAVLSGFDPPVIRSWIMGSLVYLGKAFGRSFPVGRLLAVTALTMIAWRPAFLFSLSFQLSFAATLSLVLFSDLVTTSLPFISRLPTLFREDFVATLSAQILVWPIIAFYFGRFSVISILVNTLVLWTVPLATILGGAFLLAFPLGGLAARFLAFFAYIPLDVFQGVVAAFSAWKWAQVDLVISLPFLIGYYGVLALVLKRWRVQKHRRAKIAEG